MRNQSFNFDEALKQLQSGKNLLGTDGILTPLIKQLTEAALQAEIEHYLSTTSNDTRKNGYTRKTVKLTSGQFELKTPRDRSGAFEPQLIKKNQTKLSEDIDNKICSGQLKLATTLESKWGEKYPIVLESWRSKWELLSAYFRYPKAIRKPIYMTNAVEAVHRQFRKLTKTKGAFPNENSLLKLLYIGINQVSNKWTMPISNWALTIAQLSIYFKGRLDGIIKI
ncbi:transposase [Candidatus Arsenophonus triatominarum]|uniref:transposase n=1 Tax=Candidatus Arsenophonus triatominarum TaxID=57911 RepID=UPI0007C5488A|nr:transposase [Candidatus Arsenophonus triatominarum]